MENEKTYGVWAVRNGTSMFVYAEAWCKENGKTLEFDTKEAAEDFVKETSGYTTANVHYYVREKEPEPDAVRKRAAPPENQKGKNKLQQKAGKKQKQNREFR